MNVKGDLPQNAQPTNRLNACTQEKLDKLGEEH